MSRYYGVRRLSIPAMILSLLATAIPVGAQQSLGDFTGHGDVGRVTRAGSATYDATKQSLQIAGSGANVWADRDAFHFVWRRMKGDFILTTRGALVGTGVDPHRKFGWMARTSLDSASAHVSAAVHGDGLTALQFRRSAGGLTDEVRAPISGADIVQLERRGSTYIMSAAKFGDTLSAIQITDVSLGDDVYVGLFVTAHNDTVIERATFTNVRLTVPAKATFVPYRDYIGSNLEILEVATGHRRIVYRSERSVQAPNWTPDGASLIYNQDGLLYRFNLATGKPTVINTGFATSNNNDHIISPDGSMLGISHHDGDLGGRSLVYTVPIGGGNPTRVTPFGPSYLHGWSLDGRHLVYTGVRGTATNIYRIPINGGSEQALTRNAGMNDGAEYGRDGRIYFNSSRTGTMQLFRMRGDGGPATQLTNDGFNNWFPHVSPDAKTIVFLSYSQSIDPSDHPWYKPVYLRQVASNGGVGKVVAYVYGGQGTINVPSWSPDGRFVAFVSNTDRY